MTAERLTRIERLVSVRQRQLEVVRDELAQAQRKLNEAAQLAQQAENIWHERSESLRNRSGTIAELIDTRNYIRSLRSKADHHKHQLNLAAKTYAEGQIAVRHAHCEVRKLELWSDKVAKELRDKRSRRERKQDDALAARLATGSQA
jgi:flagellar export protein FliJ